MQGGNLRDHVFKVERCHTGIADRTDLFFIGKEGDGGLCRSARNFEHRFQCGIGAYAVVVAVPCNHRVIKPDIPSLSCGDNFKLRNAEIFFGNAVFLIQNF